MMYNEEMDQWLAEASHEEARAKALLQQAILNEQQRRDEERSSLSNGVHRRKSWVSRSRSADGAGGSGDDMTNGGVIVQVVQDEDEVTTIRRQVLPDVDRSQPTSSSC